MRRALSIVLVWMSLWIVVGLSIAVATQGESAIALPIFGALYGGTAGAAHGILVARSARSGPVGPARGAVLGVVASLATVPVLWLVGGMTPIYAIGFALAAGAATGALVTPVIPGGGR